MAAVAKLHTRRTLAHRILYKVFMTPSFQDSSDNSFSMAPSSGDSERPPDGHHVQTERSTDSHTSIEDYSRIMLEYTQRRMVDFADTDDDKGYATSRSSRSSEASGKSGVSTAGLLARQGAGYTPSKIRQNSSEGVQDQSTAAGRGTSNSAAV